VNRAAALNVIIIDESKLVARLGQRWPVPVEVLAFAHHATEHHLRALGEPTLRRVKHATGRAEPFRTDGGNLVYDVKVGVIEDPAAMAAAFREIPGVLETGIFHDAIDIALVARADGVRRIERTLPRGAARSHP
jgi:ribose 5-phosphate isomerase A